MDIDFFGNKIFSKEELQSLGYLKMTEIIKSKDFKIISENNLENLIGNISEISDIDSERGISPYEQVNTICILVHQKYYDLFKFLYERKAFISLNTKLSNEENNVMIVGTTKEKNVILVVDFPLKEANIPTAKTDLFLTVDTYDRFLRNSIEDLENSVEDINKLDSEQNKRLNNIENGNVERDRRLTAVENKNSEQDGRIQEAESKNSEQDRKIANIQNSIVDINNDMSNLVKDHTYMIKFLAGFNTTDSIVIPKNSTVGVDLYPCATDEHISKIPWNNLTLVGVRDVFLGGNYKLVASRYNFNNQQSPRVTIYNTNDTDITIRKCDCGIYCSFVKNGTVNWYDDEKILVPDK